MKLSLKVSDTTNDRQSRENLSEMVNKFDFEIEFLLPNSEKTKHTFKSGKEVQDLKVFIEDTCNIPFADIALVYNGKELPNMITLNDIKGLELNSVNIFTVKQK